MTKVCLTFDVDLLDFISGKPYDELKSSIPILKDAFETFSDIKTTWFIRIDRHCEKTMGDYKYALTKYSSWFDWLRDNGHEIGWHHHGFQRKNNKWIPINDKQKLLEEIKFYGNIARSLELNISRMGWGQQTNESIAVLNDLGFKIDSSAIPRPNYSWNKFPLKDWSTTTNHIYNPSKSDYRTESSDNYEIYELPITTVELPMETDSDQGVKRYINPAYHPEIFCRSLKTLKNSALSEQGDLIVTTITHPYEITDIGVSNSQISFNHKAFIENLSTLRNNFNNFLTISHAATSFINS